MKKKMKKNIEERILILLDDIEKNSILFKNYEEMKYHLSCLHHFSSNEEKETKSISKKNKMIQINCENVAVIDTNTAPFCLKSQKNSTNFYGGFYNGNIVLFSSDGEAKNGFLGHTKLVWSIEELEKNKFASTSDDKNIFIWDVETQKIETKKTNHQIQNCIKNYQGGLIRFISFLFDRILISQFNQKKKF
jgi:WD40 repeat protein